MILSYAKTLNEKIHEELVKIWEQEKKLERFFNPFNW